MSTNQIFEPETIIDTLWVWFYRSLPVLVVVLLMLGIIK